MNGKASDDVWVHEACGDGMISGVGDGVPYGSLDDGVRAKRSGSCPGSFGAIRTPGWSGDDGQVYPKSRGEIGGSGDGAPPLANGAAAEMGPDAAYSGESGEVKLLGPF